MKRINFINIFIIFILSIIFHFLYKIIPNYLFSILFPVNESVWEHMKLVVTSTLVFSMFEYYIYRRKGIYFNNFLLGNIVSTIFGVIIYLIIYIPLDSIFGYSPFIAITLLFIIFILIEFIRNYIFNLNKIKYGNILGIILIILVYLLFWYFTYYPLKFNLFYDNLNMGYGIIQK